METKEFEYTSKDHYGTIIFEVDYEVHRREIDDIYVVINYEDSTVFKNDDSEIDDTLLRTELLDKYADSIDVEEYRYEVEEDLRERAAGMYDID